MPRTAPQRRGIARENAVKDLLEGAGWVVGRAAGSAGLFDLIAVANGFVWHPAVPRSDTIHVIRDILLIEVKSTQAGPFAGFAPAARVQLVEAADRVGGGAWLAWWPARKPGRDGKLHWFHSSTWP